MNVRDLHIIRANLLTAMTDGRLDDAYAWTRLFCRQLRYLTNRSGCMGTQESGRVA